MIRVAADYMLGYNKTCVSRIYVYEATANDALGGRNYVLFTQDIHIFTHVTLSYRKLVQSERVRVVASRPENSVQILHSFQ